VRQLQRHRPLERAVRPLGEPDRSHPAPAELTNERVRSDAIAGKNVRAERAGFRVVRRAVEPRRHAKEPLGLGVRVRFEHPQQLSMTLRTGRLQRVKPAKALVFGQPERLVEQRRQVAPGIGIELDAHGGSP
jgi:hypothetical protein